MLDGLAEVFSMPVRLRARSRTALTRRRTCSGLDLRPEADEVDWNVAFRRSSSANNLVSLDASSPRELAAAAVAVRDLAAPHGLDRNVGVSADEDDANDADADADAEEEYDDDDGDDSHIVVAASGTRKASTTMRLAREHAQTPSTILRRRRLVISELEELERLMFCLLAVFGLCEDLLRLVWLGLNLWVGLNQVLACFLSRCCRESVVVRIV